VTQLTAGTGINLTGSNGNIQISATGGGGGVTSVGISSSQLVVSGSPIVGAGTITINFPNNLSITGNITANGRFVGDGSGLSNIAVANITGLGNVALLNRDGNGSNILYGNGVFASKGSVVGATGATGIGATGATGIGATGATGIGATGATGIGATGATGIGATGATGIGATGATGIGATGATGIGATGATGIGATGATGIGATGATGPVAGSNTQVIFNDNTVANGNSSFTFDKTTGQLSATLVNGTLTTVAQPNITSVGTLTALAVTGDITSNNIVANNIVRTKPITFSSLPAAATAGTGARSFITDANLVMAGNFGSLVTGGASNRVPVVSDGTDWRIG
jgi:hypothetical protein